VWITQKNTLSEGKKNQKKVKKKRGLGRAIFEVKSVTY
jgi:hypothetical protein